MGVAMSAGVDVASSEFFHMDDDAAASLSGAGTSVRVHGVSFSVPL